MNLPQLAHSAAVGVMSPAQVRSLVESTARVNLWHGAIRSGKTIASLLRWLGYVATAPYGGELVIVGKTKDTIERNILGPLSDPGIFGPLARQVIHNRGANTCVILGRLVHVIGANDVKSEAKIRGMTCAGAYVDEVSLLPKGFFQQLLGRMSVKGAQLFGTTNPDNPAHWLKREFIDRAGDLDLRAWHFRLADNPALDPAYVRAISREFVGLWYRRMILGQWVVAEGAVFDQWDPARHVVKRSQLPYITQWLGVGIDYGTVNPFAAIMLGLGEDDRLYFTDEWRYDSRAQRAQLTDEQYSAAVRKWLGTIIRPQELAVPGVEPEWVFVDPSAASFKAQLRTDGVAGVRDAKNEVLDGIRAVSTLLGNDRLKVVDTCTGWIEEAAGYSWDDKAAAKGEDKVLKVDDHSLDAGRYAVASTAHVWRGLLESEAA